MKFRQPFQCFGGIMWLLIGVIVVLFPEWVVAARPLGIMLVIAGAGYLALFFEWVKNGEQNGQ